MAIRSLLTRLRPDQRRAASAPEAFGVLHSADLDVHLDGVMRPPTSGPPWSAPSWGRYAAARRRPSAMARVLLELHPAFAGCDTENPRWLDVERAETLAMEWAMFSPTDAASWLSAHPSMSARQATTLAERGWQPRDADLVLPDRVIELDRHLSREGHQTG